MIPSVDLERIVRNAGLPAGGRLVVYITLNV